ncbi:lamin tail domain-containing protein [Lentzea tibetensis]|uniref:Lamin tail domain-containing protein n=1 Tax=Lentzea tibetensis TaxID=2591470 RepID=A0A563EJV3_9PSEU|nr:lamin tail domain-containing protein [Lentzea tibetensis]TWP47282.1 lamin tail domain-containing protein [Lentzea tibetensis]
MRRLVIGGIALGMSALAALSGSASADEPDVTQQAISNVVINEVSAIGPNGELDEAIEIRNMTGDQLSLEGYVVRLYSSTNQVLQTIPLSGVTLEPRDNDGDILVLTGVNFSSTVAPGAQVQPIAFQGTVGIPVNGGVAIFGSAAPTAVKQDGIAMSAGAVTPKEGTQAAPENITTAQLEASNARNILSTDTNNNRVDFTLHHRTFGARN